MTASLTDGWIKCYSNNRFGHSSELSPYLVVRVRCPLINVYFVAGYTDNLSALGQNVWFPQISGAPREFSFHALTNTLLYIVHCTVYLFNLNILISPLLWLSHHCQCQTLQKRQWSRSPRKWTNLMIILKHDSTIHNLVAYTCKKIWEISPYCKNRQ